jgi:hypothetical protein
MDSRQKEEKKLKKRERQQETKYPQFNEKRLGRVKQEDEGLNVHLNPQTTSLGDRSTYTQALIDHTKTRARRRKKGEMTRTASNKRRRVRTQRKF